jgi:hypothetical protein
MALNAREIEAHALRLRQLCNGARFGQAHRVSKSLLRKHPNVLEFAYYEAVLSAEDDFSFSDARNEVRFRGAARKLRLLLRRMRSAPDLLKFRIRNEYYWFSKQPYKQYLLGKKELAKGNRGGHYCVGVGAAQMAKSYGLQGRSRLRQRWAEISEKAWLHFFRVQRKWSNSYLFYAMAVGVQGRHRDMELALARAAAISRKPKDWKALRKVRRQVEAARSSSE